MNDARPHGSASTSFLYQVSRLALNIADEWKGQTESALIHARLALKMTNKSV